MEILGGALLLTASACVCFGCLFRCFFSAVGQTLKRIVNTKWAVVTNHIRACLCFIFKKSLEILYFSSESTTSKLHPAHHWWVFWKERFPPRRTSPSSCHVMLEFYPNIFVQKVNKNSGGKKSQRNGKKSHPVVIWHLRDPMPPGHPCHWDPAIFSKPWGNPNWISFKIQQLQHLRPPGEIEIAFRWVKLLWLSHWMGTQRVLGSPLPPNFGPWWDHETFSGMGKVGNAFSFPSKTVGSIRMLPRHHETWQFLPENLHLSTSHGVVS